MISYELAKQLRDAGFPQEFKSGNLVMVKREEGDVYIPTLSELIEACGDKFLELTNLEHEWSAARIEVVDGKEKVFFELAPTKEEAVARLWLKINKKQETQFESIESGKSVMKAMLEIVKKNKEIY